MIPILNGIKVEIDMRFNGSFLDFLNAPIFKKRKLLREFKWEWINKNGTIRKQEGWSHHRIYKISHLVYILDKAALLNLIRKIGSESNDDKKFREQIRIIINEEVRKTRLPSIRKFPSGRF